MPRAQGIAWMACRCGCGKPAIVLDAKRGLLAGYVRGHHQRDPHHPGNRPTPGRYPKLGRTDFFWSRVDFSDPLNCWTWTGKTNQGYGRMSMGINGAWVPAHRFSYELANGPIPEELVIDHLCRNPGCVRPDHLEVVTQGENVRRGRACKRLTGDLSPEYAL